MLVRTSRAHAGAVYQAAHGQSPLTLCQLALAALLFAALLFLSLLSGWGALGVVGVLEDGCGGRAADLGALLARVLHAAGGSTHGLVGVVVLAGGANGPLGAVGVVDGCGRGREAAREVQEDELSSCGRPQGGPCLPLLP